MNEAEVWVLVACGIVLAVLAFFDHSKGSGPDAGGGVGDGCDGGGDGGGGGD